MTTPAVSLRRRSGPPAFGRIGAPSATGRVAA